VWYTCVGYGATAEARPDAGRGGLSVRDGDGDGHTAPAPRLARAARGN
jgi:hypothetical protein